MILHPHQCPACAANVLKPFPFRRTDGVEVQFCVACGTGSVPEAEFDFDKIYSPNYYLEAAGFGYPEDPPKRFVRSLFWKIYWLHGWARHLSATGAPVQILDVGAGISPARALIGEDQDRIAWLDTDVSEFASTFSTLAFGQPDDRRAHAAHTLAGFFEVLEHVEDPAGFLSENLSGIGTTGHAAIYVPHAGYEIANAEGSAWGQLGASLEHTLYFSALGLERLLQRLDLSGGILTTNVGLLAVVNLPAQGGEILHFSDWELFADHHGIPRHALYPFASLHGLSTTSPLSATSDFERVAERADRAMRGSLEQALPRERVQHRWSYGRLLEEYHWALEVESAQLGSKPLTRFEFPAPAQAVPSYRDRMLHASAGDRLRIMYVAPKWDYGFPERGWSYEHQNFYPTLYLSECTETFLHFDFVDYAKRYGVNAMSEHLVTTALRFKPDVMFFVFFNEEHDPTHEALAILGSNPSLPMTTVGWFSDDQYRFDSYTINHAPFLNACVTTLPPDDERYRSAGLGDKVLHSGWAANPYYYQKSSQRNFKYDVSICGQPHSDRRVIVDLLRQAGLEVATFGTGWDANSRISFSDMLSIFHQTKVNLNPSLTAHWDPGQMKGRMFEVPACGRFLLTGPTDGLEEFYDAHSEMPVYYDYADMIDKIRLFLANDVLRDEIAANAYRKVLSEHTWEHRYRAIFKKVAPKRRFLAKRM